jgi:hypothetical protein
MYTMKALLFSRKLLCTLGILWGTRTFILGLGGWLLFGHQSASEYVSFTLTLMSLLPASIAAFFVPRAVAVAETFVCVVAIIFTYRTRSAHGGEWFYVLIAANLLFVGCLILIEFLLTADKGTTDKGTRWSGPLGW